MSKKVSNAFKIQPDFNPNLASISLRAFLSLIRINELMDVINYFEWVQMKQNIWQTEAYVGTVFVKFHYLGDGANAKAMISF